MVSTKLFSVIFLAPAITASSFTIVIPSSSSSILSNPVSPDFIGLSIEMSSATSILRTETGTDANPFFISYINNMKTRTSAAPSLRVGGNSADEGIFMSTFQQNRTVALPTLTGIMATISKATGARWTITLNFSNATSTTNASNLASSALQDLGDNLQAFEIGNEPDIYPRVKRDQSYNISQYATEWTAFAQSLNSQLSSQDLLPARPLYQAGAFSGRWNTGQLIGLGFLSTSGSLVSSLSQHRYGEDGCSSGAKPTSVGLLNHGTIQSHASAFGPSVAASLAAQKRFVVGETNSISCGGFKTISDTVTATLWAVDWILQLASRNVSAVNFHTSLGSDYAPFSVNPWVARPLYYAFIITAEALSQQPTITELKLDDENTVAYLVYAKNDSSRPSKIVLIDTNIASFSSSPRMITLSFTSNLTAIPISIKRLTSPSFTETVNIQWAGQTFKDSRDGNLLGSIRLERPNSVNEGNVELQLYPASVVMVELDVQPNADPYVPTSKMAPRMVEGWGCVISVVMVAALIGI